MSWLRLVHRWIGLVLGVAVAAVALSGGLLLARGPYERARYPALAEPMVPRSIASHAAQVGAIEARFGAGDGLRIIKWPRPGTNAYHLYFADDTEAFVAPDTAVLLGRWSWRDDPAAFLFELHAHLLGAETASTINGLAALGVVFLSLTGVLLWWPRRAGAFRLRRAAPRGLAPGELLRSHAASGAIAVLPVLIFVATGAALIFFAPVSSTLSRLFDGRAPMAPTARVARRAPDTPVRPWTERLAQVQATFPAGDLVMWYPGRGANAVETFRLRLPGEWHPNGRSYVLLDPYDSRVVQRIDARQQGPGTRLAQAVYPLHAATVGGAPYVAFAALGAVGLAWLAIGGTAAYVQKWRLTRRVERPVQTLVTSARKNLN